jgi:hypothetical protein
VGGVFAIGEVFFKTSRTRSVKPPLQTFFILTTSTHQTKKNQENLKHAKPKQKNTKTCTNQIK